MPATTTNDTLSLNEKYRLYEESVQNHLADIEFLNQEYTRFFGRRPLSLREDFCGTAAMACDWIKQSAKHQAWGVDIDPEPMSYGKKHHFSRLMPSERKRMQYIQGDVLDTHPFKVDLIVAFNFSYQVFKTRRQLLEYFKKVCEGLSPQGAFFLDIFGGTESRKELEEETEFDHHSYYWDCDQYNPITHETTYHIHFKYKGKKCKKVFSYDWRLWSIAELRDIMIDAGFSRSLAYWEGENEEEGGEEEGEGNGEFYLSENEENCESWVTYLCGLP